MKHVRPTLLAAAALTFIISACSQPEDVQASTLAPQFGTEDRDVGVDVALAPENGVYVLSRQFGANEDEGIYYYRVLLGRYSSSRNLLWMREANRREISQDAYGFASLTAVEVEHDSTGNAYVLNCANQVFQDSATASNYKITVYDASGQLKRSFSVGEVIWPFGNTAPEPIPDVAIDAERNMYLAIQQATVDDNYDFTTVNLIRKYSPTGSLVWERTSSVGIPTGVAVSGDGSVYVSGRSGLARYNSSGTLLWKKAGFYNGVAVSGSSVFAYNKNTVYRFNGSGQQQGSSFMNGLSGVIIQDLSGDGAGSVLVSGKYTAGTGNRDAFVRKLSATGSSQWTSTFGTPVFDDAQGVVAVGTREAYVTGTTLGSLAHPSRGEEDGYVRKLGVGGQPIWTR